MLSIYPIGRSADKVKLEKKHNQGVMVDVQNVFSPRRKMNLNSVKQNKMPPGKQAALKWLHKIHFHTD